MNTLPLGRAGGSTRGFATTDPERQGVFVGTARQAPRMSLMAPITTRAAGPQASSGGSRAGSAQRGSCAAPK